MNTDFKKDDLFFIITVETFQGNVYFYKGSPEKKPETQQRVIDYLDSSEYTQAISEACKFATLDDISLKQEAIIESIRKNICVKEIWVQQVEIQALFHQTFKLSDLQDRIDALREKTQMYDPSFLY